MKNGQVYNREVRNGESSQSWDVHLFKCVCRSWESGGHRVSRVGAEAIFD